MGNRNLAPRVLTSDDGRQGNHYAVLEVKGDYRDSELEQVGRDNAGLAGLESNNCKVTVTKLNPNTRGDGIYAVCVTEPYQF